MIITTLSHNTHAMITSHYGHVDRWDLVGRRHWLLTASCRNIFALNVKGLHYTQQF